MAVAADPLGPDAPDFWLGEWDLHWGESGRGTNRIERTVGDRVITTDAGDSWTTDWAIDYRRR